MKKSDVEGNITKTAIKGDIKNDQTPRIETIPENITRLRVDFNINFPDGNLFKIMKPTGISVPSMFWRISQSE